MHLQEKQLETHQYRMQIDLSDSFLLYCYFIAEPFS